MIVGDDDPATPIGTFELVSGAINVTVYKGSFATIDAPRLKATSKGADFAITVSPKDSEVIVRVVIEPVSPDFERPTAAQ